MLDAALGLLLMFFAQGWRGRRGDVLVESGSVRRVRRVNRCRVSFSLGDSQEPHRIIAGHRLVRSVPTRPECRRTLIGQHTPPRRESLAARASCDWDYSALQHSVTPAGTGSVLPPSDGGGRSERGSGDPRRTTGGDLWGLCTIRG